MNPRLGWILLAGVLACVGCVQETLPESALAPVGFTAKALPPVTSEQITDKNGHQVAQALDEELTREAQQNMLNSLPR